jgi:hypothetical protein
MAGGLLKHKPLVPLVGQLDPTWKCWNCGSSSAKRRRCLSWLTTIASGSSFPETGIPPGFGRSRRAAVRTISFWCTGRPSAMRKVRSPTCTASTHRSSGSGSRAGAQSQTGWPRFSECRSCASRSRSRVRANSGSTVESNHGPTGQSDGPPSTERSRELANQVIRSKDGRRRLRPFNTSPTTWTRANSGAGAPAGSPHSGSLVVYPWRFAAHNVSR